MNNLRSWRRKTSDTKIVEIKTSHLKNGDLDIGTWGMEVAGQPRKYEPPVRGMFAQQQHQRHLWSKVSEFKPGQVRKERDEKKVEVHLKFYTLLFIYTVFLDGAVWTAEGFQKNPTKKTELLCNRVHT